MGLNALFNGFEWHPFPRFFHQLEWCRGLGSVVWGVQVKPFILG